MGIKDDINRILRDHEGYTGDGRGGVGDLPIGDRSTARKPISKRDLREVLGAVHDSVADPAAAAEQAVLDARAEADRAEQAVTDAAAQADRAEDAASGVEYPVSYAPQTLTAPQQAQARDNIGAADGAAAVAVTEQTFTASQQSTARQNIDAVSRQGDTLIGGFTSEALILGDVSGTLTLTANRNFQQLTNTGSTTINVPTEPGSYTLIIYIVNGSSAGAVTLSGFIKVDGDNFTTGEGDAFILYITKVPDAALIYVVALQ